MSKRRQKKAIRIMSAAVAAAFGLSLAVTGRANTMPTDYSVEMYGYEGWADTVSQFVRKHKNNSMVVACYQASNMYRVRALGANALGFIDTYADCSRGYYYWLCSGDVEDDVVNFVKDDGYGAAGIEGAVIGDQYFTATGYFIADKP